MAEKTYMLVVAALQAAILAWGLLAPMTAGQQPVIAGTTCIMEITQRIDVVYGWSVSSVCFLHLYVH